MPRGTSRYDEARLQGRLFDAIHTATRPATYINFNRRESLSISSGLISSARNLGTSGDPFSSSGSGTYPPLGVLPNGTTVGSFTTTTTLCQATSSGLNNSDPTYTIINLARIKAGNSGLRVVQGGMGTNFVFGFYSTQWDVFYDGNFHQSTLRSETSGEFHLTTIRSSAAYVADMRSNGVAISVNATAVGSAPTTLGINTDAFGEHSNCEVFALAAWYGALSNSDINKVEGAFAWEAGLQDSVLPAGHPYKNRPPTIGG
jgi:hypothetical protein